MFRSCRVSGLDIGSNKPSPEEQESISERSNVEFSKATCLNMAGAMATPTDCFLAIFVLGNLMILQDKGFLYGFKVQEILKSLKPVGC